MKGYILPFPKKGDLGLAKNYQGITLTSIAAKIYNTLLRNRIEPEINNILRFGLVSLFNGISTFVGYLMPKPFS